MGGTEPEVYHVFLHGFLMTGAGLLFAVSLLCLFCAAHDSAANSLERYFIVGLLALCLVGLAGLLVLV